MLTRSFAPVLALSAEASPIGFRFVPRLNEALPRRAWCARLISLHRHLLKRLALDRERVRATQREMRQPQIGKAQERPA
ncbi:hypothetical protein HNP32_001289 [Brevundimonas bullata]|uniref:Uncharacterized protein n=1 Tax=Brevundimonas bullata TaxID=13160 RepID=A0A7W7IPC5_9CAUL|nr:hypothetical protein [Brevundimonas bullata]MBB6382525.1 hypothetical protein [Brevundimonas bullata]